MKNYMHISSVRVEQKIGHWQVLGEPNIVEVHVLGLILKVWGGEGWVYIILFALFLL